MKMMNGCTFKPHILFASQFYLASFMWAFTCPPERTHTPCTFCDISNYDGVAKFIIVKPSRKLKSLKIQICIILLHLKETLPVKRETRNQKIARRYNTHLFSGGLICLLNCFSCYVKLYIRIQSVTDNYLKILNIPTC